MTLPFTREQFFDVFAQYNQYVWPAQIVLLGIAVACVIALVRRGTGGRAIGWALALFWAWMAIAYHVAFFAKINPAAWFFAAFFWAGAALFAWHAQRGALRFELGVPTTRVERAASFTLVAYALVGYPLVGALAGQRYPAMPTFGLPCPTTIFTLGLLLLAPRVPVGVLVVPLAWSLVGSVAAFQLGVVEDLGLLAAALVTMLMLVFRGVSVRLRAARR